MADPTAPRLGTAALVLAALTLTAVGLWLLTGTSAPHTIPPSTASTDPTPTTSALPAPTSEPRTSLENPRRPARTPSSAPAEATTPGPAPDPAVSLEDQDAALDTAREFLTAAHTRSWQDPTAWLEKTTQYTTADYAHRLTHTYSDTGSSRWRDQQMTSTLTIGELELLPDSTETTATIRATYTVTVTGEDPFLSTGDTDNATILILTRSTPEQPWTTANSTDLTGGGL